MTQLLTLRGLECIQEADVILYDRLVNPVLLKHAKKEVELIYCGKEPGKHGLIQEEIHRVLVEKALQGHHVLRLKGGDPFVFGRGAEEAAVLKKANIGYEIVPEITAGIAAPGLCRNPCHTSRLCGKLCDCHRTRESRKRARFFKLGSTYSH